MPWVALEVDDKKGLVVEVKGNSVPSELTRVKSSKVFEKKEDAEAFLRERGLRHVREGSIAGKALTMCGMAPY